MGNKESSGNAADQAQEEKEEEKGLFAWQRLPPPPNETIHYDPRYEHVVFTQNGLYVSDYHNRVFEWECKVNEEQEPIGYELKSFKKYEWEDKSGYQAGKRFDKNATSLAWIRQTVLHYYDFKEMDKVFSFDVSEWMATKYGENNTAKISQPKAVINLGQGQMLFMVSHFDGTDKNAKNINRGTDVVQMDVVNKKEIKSIPIQTELLRSDEDLHYQCVYWGFQLNPTGKEISILIQGERNVTYVLFVSLLDGSVLWQSRFDFVHDLSFNDNGKFACVFERPRKTEFGYVHVLNVTRLEWICQIQLTYGTSPLGWDGFTWMHDSLVFMAPFDLKVVSPGAMEWRMAETKKQNEIQKQERAEKLKKLQQAEEEEEEEEEQPEQQADADAANNSNEEAKANIITPAKWDEIAQQQKSKEICVLSIGERWWDLEKETTDLIFKEVEDENITHLILEYGGFAWAMLKFPYPKDRFAKSSDSKDQNAMMLQGAMSEVFQSGAIGNFDILLLGTIARDPRTKIFNHWMFCACAVPKTFGEMWKNPKIQQGVIAQITNVNEESHLRPLDSY